MDAPFSYLQLQLHLHLQLQLELQLDPRSLVSPPVRPLVAWRLPQDFLLGFSAVVSVGPGLAFLLLLSLSLVLAVEELRDPGV